MRNSTNPDHNRKLAGDFAYAVATPGTCASVIDAENHRIGTCSIQEAVDRDLPFFIDGRSDLVTLDLDGPFAVLDSELLLHWLRHRGIRPVVTASGGGQNRHLFAIVDDPRIREDLLELAKELGVDCRVGSQSIRPPLARHRLGGRSELLTPRSPKKALRRLRRTARPMSARMTQLLFHGDTQGRYSSRSEQDMAIACEVVRIGGTVEDLAAIFRTSRSSVGERIRAASDRRARQELDRLWEKATERLAGASQTPKAKKRADRTRRRLAGVRAAIEVAPQRWRGIAGANDRALLLVLIEVGESIGSDIVGMDVRNAQLRIGAGSTSTASRAFTRLCSGDAPWLERVERGNGKTASRWRILDQGVGDGTTSLRGGVNLDCSVDCPCRAVLDLLTAKQRQVLDLLSDQKPQTTRAIATQLATEPSNVRIHLASLSIRGLAHCDGRLWVRCHAELHDLAARLEVEGARSLLRRRHAAERRDFRRRFGIDTTE